MKKTLVSIILASAFSLTGCAISNKSCVTDYLKTECNDSLYDYSSHCLKNKVSDIYNSTYQIEVDYGIEGTGAGTGILFDGGYFMTAAHVLGEGGSNPILKSNGLEFALEEVARDNGRDFLLLKLRDNIVGLNTYKFNIGDSNEVSIGNKIYITGNALNLGVNAREGIVAQKEVKGLMNYDVNLIGISAGGNPGDSGCPVFAIRDGRYELIGMLVGGISEANNLTYMIAINDLSGELSKYVK